MKYTINSNIFATFPGFQRGVVIARDINNLTSGSELARILSHEAAEVAGACWRVPDPRLEAWDQAYRTFGANPRKFSPSITFLVSQTQKGKPPRSICPLVDAFNIISLKYRMPCGGDDLSALEDGEIELGIAKGNELFAPLFRPDEFEHPSPGEVIYFNPPTDRVMCRRWNWRNADFSRIRPETRSVAINIDALAPSIHRTTLETATEELAALVSSYCGGSVKTTILDGVHSSFTL